MATDVLGCACKHNERHAVNAGDNQLLAMDQPRGMDDAYVVWRQLGCVWEGQHLDDMMLVCDCLICVPVVDKTFGWRNRESEPFDLSGDTAELLFGHVRFMSLCFEMRALNMLDMNKTSSEGQGNAILLLLIAQEQVALRGKHIFGMNAGLDLDCGEYSDVDVMGWPSRASHIGVKPPGHLGLFINEELYFSTPDQGRE